ncbi:hypothetical protein NA56DRAFT_749987 [Hyaloscypha hepaticicola]|uniref:Uncharacterized protein n=1 Tax=Hyaloscypha hepaticicola TaxID=2082293 RepID=A0A2J6Q1E3_9HELO|nr:hypothetical protein NA56DRAFT_749987 [Hyaloscypha hepaticicola]
MTRKSSNKKGGHSLSQSHHETSKPKPQAQKVESSTEAPRCPYHHSILRLEPSTISRYGLPPMKRFITESSSETSSLFLRPDTGKPSTSKECLCGANNAAEKQSSKENAYSEGAYGTK